MIIRYEHHEKGTFLVLFAVAWVIFSINRSIEISQLRFNSAKVNTVYQRWWP